MWKYMCITADFRRRWEQPVSQLGLQVANHLPDGKPKPDLVGESDVCKPLHHLGIYTLGNNELQKQ
eukprot:gene1543-4692_t